MELTLDQIDWHDMQGRRVRPRIYNGMVVFLPWRKGFRDLILWASGKSNYYISKLLNQVWNATSYTFPTTEYFALWTATLSASSTGSTAGEASYTGYARVAMTCNATNFSTSSSGSSTTNNVAITWPSNTGTTQTMTYAAACDASTTGNIIYWGSITSTPINNGDTPQVAASGLTSSEA